MKRNSLCSFAILLLIAACGDDDAAGGGGSGGSGGPDANPGAGTGGVPACSDGIDNDGDGLIDGFDPECTGPLDDREGSFATGIPGDNIDAIKQDCFFDGDSGHGNDGCELHTCCLLDGECPADLKPEQYDPNDCTPSQQCIDFCAPITPPGCDCFGCCTICNDEGCYDVYTNPEVAPDCTLDELGNPDKCPSCTKVESCGPGGGDCTDLECNLCPGQTTDDLPDECMGENTCPDDLQPCIDTADCPDGKFCSVGCCINEIQ